MKTSDNETSPQTNKVPAVDGISEKIPFVLRAVGTPLKFFGLAAMLCLPVFSIAAANVKDKAAYDAFIYTLHTYLAVVGMLALIALFSPRSLYHPREIQDLKSPDLLPKNRPIVPCVIALLALAMYLAYQAFVVNDVAGIKSKLGPTTTNAAATSQTSP